VAVQSMCSTVAIVDALSAKLQSMISVRSASTLEKNPFPRAAAFSLAVVAKDLFY
jgi:hypothetical protein